MKKNYIFTGGEKVVVKEVRKVECLEDKVKYYQGTITKIGTKYYYVTYKDGYYEEEVKINKNTHELTKKGCFNTYIYTIQNAKLCKHNKLYYLNKIDLLDGVYDRKINFKCKYKTTYTSKIKNDITNAIKNVNEKFNIKIDDEIEFEYGNNFAQKSTKVLGIYVITKRGRKIICYNDCIYKNANINPMRVIYHELGHYVHIELLKESRYILPLEGKTEYACKDFYEDFAEGFADYMINNKDTLERNMFFENIIKNNLKKIKK